MRREIEKIKEDFRMLRLLNRWIQKDIEEGRALRRQLEATKDFPDFETERERIRKNINIMSEAIRENTKKTNDIYEIYLRAISNLKPLDRRIAILVYIEGRTYEQAAAFVGLSAGTIKNHKIPLIIETVQQTIKN